MQARSNEGKLSISKRYPNSSNRKGSDKENNSSSDEWNDGFESSRKPRSKCYGGKSSGIDAATFHGPSAGTASRIITRSSTKKPTKKRKPICVSIDSSSDESNDDDVELSAFKKNKVRKINDHFSSYDYEDVL